MEVRLELDRDVLYRSRFPICNLHASRQGIHYEHTLHFKFEPKREITWSGYRDTNNVTASGQRLRGDLWLAGAEADDLLLGVSFLTDKAIFMNTLHIAYPTRINRTEIEPGLILITEPLPSPPKVGPSSQVKFDPCPVGQHRRAGPWRQLVECVRGARVSLIR